MSWWTTESWHTTSDKIPPLGHKVFCGYLLFHVLARTAACRKLPGKLLTEIGERYLFSTSDGSLEIKDFAGRFGMAFTFRMILKLVICETCAEKKAQAQPCLKISQHV